jgi:uridine kinase
MPAGAVSGAARAVRELIAIDGLDGSGKSQFARALAAACEAEGAGPVVVFHVDDFRRPLPTGASPVDEAMLYYDRSYDFALLDACLRAFLRGAPGITIPRFDPVREGLEGEHPLRFDDARLALVEGVFVMRAAEAAAAPLIALEITEAEARRRILVRDLARGRSLDVVEHRIDHRYFPAQRRYREAFDPLRRADVVIDNQHWDHPRLLRCAKGRLPGVAERALFRVVPS